ENVGGLGIALFTPPGIPPGSFPVITSIVPNAATTTITGFFDVPVGLHVPTFGGIEFFSSPACSKKRPRDFDEGKTPIGSMPFTAFSPHVTFSMDVPVVITDEVVTAVGSYTSCFPLGEGGCDSATFFGPFSQRLPYSISPSSGAPAGGDTITISGSNFV